MEQYTQKVYEWLHVEPSHPTLILEDLPLAQQLCTGAAVQGVGPDPIAGAFGLAQLLSKDPNHTADPRRDSRGGFFQITLITQNGARKSVCVRSITRLSLIVTNMERRSGSEYYKLWREVIRSQ